MQLDEIGGGRGAERFGGKREGFVDGVGVDVDLRLLGKSFVERRVVKFRGDGETQGLFVAAVDDVDAVVVVGILHVERLAGFFGAEVATGGLEIVIEEVPDGGGPSVIEHPLDDACGGVFVAGVRLEHGALAFVGHSLRFQLVVVEAGGRAVDARPSRY